MTEKYTGTVKEIKPAEMGQNGKQKPRKVIISDSPDYAGRTFSAWEWKDWFSVFEVGKQVTVEYEKRPLPSFPDRFTNDVQVAYVAEWSGNGSGGGHDSSPEADSPSSDPPSDVARLKHQLEEAERKAFQAKANAAGIPPPVDKYTDEAPKQDPWDERSYQMEAAWAVKAVMDFYEDEIKRQASLDTAFIYSMAIALIELKRKVAGDVKRSDWHD